jgi:ComF family protein
LSNLADSIFDSCLGWMQHLLSESCLLCGGSGQALCVACEKGLPWLPRERCRICALPVFGGSTCGSCLARPPAFDRVTALFSYDYPVDAMIHAFKYGGELVYARVYGQALARVVSGDVDMVIPMPLSAERLAHRGFNQARELAVHAAARWQTPVIATACRRIADTVPQAALPWKERARNVRRAFVCDADVRGKRVAVVDDVLTTGATLNELAKNLKRAGAAEVHGWVIARALPKSPH